MSKSNSIISSSSVSSLRRPLTEWANYLPPDERATFVAKYNSSHN
jgi:hypothetical protein